ncbi:MAG: TAT-variant-translocated molybdopterin oxidoreductase, partial [Chloroflexota bacterium]|nr:TAT-variant-translocated molybdopterin oxidoreductase [Chloroflexota bacterium]
MQEERYDPAAIRARLAEIQGERRQWRSLEEMAESEALQDFLEREFPRQAVALREGVDRRTFLKIMGAALALAGASGCTVGPPEEKIIPYVTQPEEIIPGKPLFFATAMTLGGFATGVLVETHEGRPTRIEGNPDHPASLGATDPFAQASILELYNPDRSRHLTNLQNIWSWDDFRAMQLNSILADLRENDGTGLRILTETVTSPTLAGQLEALLDLFPQARWHQYEPVAWDYVVEGSRLAFGEVVNTIYNFLDANVILCLDADFLTTFPGHLRYAREFIARRKVRVEEAEMSRLYVVESMMTNTGAMADHRLPLGPTQIEAFTRALAAAVGVEAGPVPETFHFDSQWFATLVRDLQQNRGASIVIPGVEQPPAVHALAHAINAELDNVGSTVIYTPPVVVNPVNQTEELQELVRDMAAGEVETLVILGGNPAFGAPVDIPFASYLTEIPNTIHLSLYLNETSVLCDWHIPQKHYLEEWSDARAFDGTASIIQPIIGPLWEDTRSDHELLAILMEEEEPSGYAIVRAHWEAQIETGDFERFWRRALHEGVIEGSAADPNLPTLRPDIAERIAATAELDVGDGELGIIFRPDPTIWDGRFASNAWLQELPKPLTKISWDNAALISPATARRRGLATEDLVLLRFREYEMLAPIWVMPGHADDAVTISLGYGRLRGGEVGIGTGFNAYAIRTSDAPWFASGLEVQKTGEHYVLATTQQHHQMEGPDPVRVGTLQQFRENPDFVHDGHPSPPFPTILPEYIYESYAWGMSIDLTACIGCNACVIACQSENNIPTVGKLEVERGREMYWIHIDRYYEGDVDNPRTYFQPVPCMHCEKAPCELVCPVEATVHSSEGLNQMIYDRCIGTRYCSNNCPYMVRRFNFLHYVDEIPILQELRNPDVSVRPAGVMEKCTYCVQRI